MNQKLTVIGAGRMGSAVAAALYKRGFDTTVWNRTKSKTESLSRLGLRVAPSVLGAVGNAEIVIVNINNYESTNQLVRQPAIESALRGKVLVQLSSGTPDEAREMESWARPRGVASPGDSEGVARRDCSEFALNYWEQERENTTTEGQLRPAARPPYCKMSTFCRLLEGEWKRI
jgi:6-phosphogluconate dehydrogenase-like protein